MTEIESVAVLRSTIKTRVKPLPGFYKWWFCEECLNVLFDHNHLALDKKKLQTKKIKGKVYFALYFGIAKDCQMRASWHITQHHTPSLVRSGYLSTLRRTLSALLGVDMTKAEICVNDFIDKNCYWDWSYTATKADAEKIETAELSTNYYPLNIMKNNVVNKIIIKTIKDLRKKHKK